MSSFGSSPTPFPTFRPVAISPLISPPLIGYERQKKKGDIRAVLLTSSPGRDEAAITVDSQEVKSKREKNLLFDVMHGSSLSMSIKAGRFPEDWFGQIPVHTYRNTPN